MIVYRSRGEVPPATTPTCVALGLFDGVHLGHQAVIGAAVERAVRDGLRSCVFTFSIYAQHPAAKPITGRLLSPPMQEDLLTAMGVDLMLCPPFEDFRGLTPQGFVEDILHKTLGASTVFCGENYHFGKGAVAGPGELRQLGAALGIEVETLSMVDIDGQDISSTRIRACVTAGDMPTAAKLLGRPFAIRFEVIHGRQLGRTLDSPTINQALPPWFAVPRFGVYATRTTVEGKGYISATNVGVKPTVGSEYPLAETYIHDFRGDLYGQIIPVEFLEFIRPEVKFASVEELRAQIQRDNDTAIVIGKNYNIE